MRHARADFDGVQPWPQKRPHIARVHGEVHFDLPDDAAAAADPVIPEDEPVALLRGQDPIAWRAVEAYCDLAEAEGVQTDLIAALRRHAVEMRDWCEKTGHGLPDAPEHVLR